MDASTTAQHARRSSACTGPRSVSFPSRASDRSARAPYSSVSTTPARPRVSASRWRCGVQGVPGAERDCGVDARRPDRNDDARDDPSPRRARPDRVGRNDAARSWYARSVSSETMPASRACSPASARVRRESSRARASSSTRSSARNKDARYSASAVPVFLRGVAGVRVASTGAGAARARSRSPPASWSAWLASSLLRPNSAISTTFPWTSDDGSARRRRHASTARSACRLTWGSVCPAASRRRYRGTVPLVASQGPGASRASCRVHRGATASKTARASRAWPSAR